MIAQRNTWLQETGRFYGSAFVEMDTSTSAAAALAKTGQELMGRPIKVNYAPARPGDVWPPQQNTGSSAGGTGKSSGGQAGGVGIKALGEKPPDCVKLFIGNLSYDIDDDGITKFFASVDAEIKAVRWLRTYKQIHANTLFDSMLFVPLARRWSQGG